ncbi:helix-turn-helix domain-containing protein [Xylanimonas ulmi]|uniref:helix-turn-helix domain-containing protein n=1 Tax=Xylanimonas ulmi TaxID=228973 RepID=UPI00102D04F9|nr:helix-turn-helix transcriptional regulator [Xylanibacterium ulmi]
MAEKIVRTAEQADTLRQLVQQPGMTQRKAGKALGVSQSTIARWSDDLGIPWNRDPVKPAVAAKVFDAKAKRAQLEKDLLDDAARLRQQIWEPHEYIDHGGKNFTEVRWTQAEPSPADKLKLMQAATVAVRHSLDIAKHDSEANEYTEQRNVVDELMDRLRRTAPTDDDGEAVEG